MCKAGGRELIFAETDFRMYRKLAVRSRDAKYVRNDDARLYQQEGAHEARDLADLERWMLEVVSHPEGVEAGFAAARSKGLLPPGTSVLEDVVPGNARLGAVEQLAIYAHMYFGRIGDVLAEEFPTVVELFGRERFEALTRSYLVEHPSTSWTLDRVGLAFSAYLAARAAAVGELDGDSERLSFASALARVERAMDQVWNDPFEEALPYDELAALRSEGSPQVVLVCGAPHL